MEILIGISNEDVARLPGRKVRLPGDPCEAFQQLVAEDFADRTGAHHTPLIHDGNRVGQGRDF